MCKEIFWRIFRRSGRQLVLSGIVRSSVQFSLSLVVIRWNSKHSLLLGVCLCVCLSLQTHSRQLGTDQTSLVGMSLHTECQSNVSTNITTGFRKVHTCSPNNSFKQKSHHLLIKKWIKKTRRCLMFTVSGQQATKMCSLRWCRAQWTFISSPGWLLFRTCMTHFCPDIPPCKDSHTVSPCSSHIESDARHF